MKLYKDHKYKHNYMIEVKGYFICLSTLVNPISDTGNLLGDTNKLIMVGYY